MPVTPVYSAEDEMALMARLWSKDLRDDPYAFVNYIFPWGQKNTPLEHHRAPRKWQRRVLQDVAEHIKKNKGKLSPDMLRLAVASGRGIGKSALVSWLVLWFLSTRIGATAIISANSENQLRTVTWSELQKWVSLSINSHWWDPSATRLSPAPWLAESVERDLKISSRYWYVDGKLWSEERPDAYAGSHNAIGMLLIFDEAAGLPDSIYSVAAGFFSELNENRFWFCFSNPRRNSGYFYEIFKGSKRQFWNTRNIDARTVEGSDQAIYTQIIEEYGPDSYQAKVEVAGEFPSEGDDQFIDVNTVDDAMERPLYKDDTAPVVVGVDPARFGGDSTVIAVRKGRDIVSVKRYRGADTMQTVGHIIETIEEYKPDMVVIDEGGLGAGVVDRAKEQNYKVRGVNFGWKSSNHRAWVNKRAEMWHRMRDWLKTASLPHDKFLKADLIGPKQLVDSKGAIALEPKKAMKARGVASPDAADAIACTFAFPVANRSKLVDKRRTPAYSSPAAPQTSWLGH